MSRTPPGRGRLRSWAVPRRWPSCAAPAARRRRRGEHRPRRARPTTGLQVLVSVPEGADGRPRRRRPSPSTARTPRPPPSQASRRPARSSARPCSRSTPATRCGASASRRPRPRPTTFLDTVPDDVYVGIVTFDSDVTAALAADAGPRRGPRRSSTGSTLQQADPAVRRRDRRRPSMAGAEGQRSVLVLSDGADTSETPLDDVTDGDHRRRGAGRRRRAGPGRRGARARSRRMADAGDGRGHQRRPGGPPAGVRRRGRRPGPPGPRHRRGARGRHRRRGQRRRSPSRPATEHADRQRVRPAPQAVEPDVGGPTLRRRPPRWSLAATGRCTAAVGLLGVGLVVDLHDAGARPAEARARAPTSGSSKYTAMTDREASAAADAPGARRRADPGQAGRRQHAAPQQEPRGPDRRAARGRRQRPQAGRVAAAARRASSSCAGLVGLLLGGGNLLLGLPLRRRRPVPALDLPRLQDEHAGCKAFNALAARHPAADGRLARRRVCRWRSRSTPSSARAPSRSPASSSGCWSRPGSASPSRTRSRAIAERFESKDFAWVVMAIKIQRQVGGNLAELLNTVAGTIREREYMRRQVAALAAEGKLSAYVLGGLPPALPGLPAARQPRLRHADVHRADGLGDARRRGVLLLGVGIFWMSRSDQGGGLTWCCSSCSGVALFATALDRCCRWRPAPRPRPPASTGPWPSSRR